MERDQLQHPDIDGRIILRLIFRTWVGGMVDVAQDTDRWRAVVNVVMNVRIP
jgi:hypothetical protein